MSIKLEYDEATLKFYAENAPIYKASGKGGVNKFLPAFMRMLPKGARVLDLGCGGGRDSEAMLLNGFEVEAWDASEKIAIQAQRRLKRRVFVKRFDELDVDSEFDAIWASASLLHVPITTLPDVVTRIHAALKLGGVHFASYKSEGVEGRDAVGRYFNHPSKNQIKETYQKSGRWYFREIHEYQGGGYDKGKQGPWAAVFALKR